MVLIKYTILFPNSIGLDHSTTILFYSQFLWTVMIYICSPIFSFSSVRINLKHLDFIREKVGQGLVLFNLLLVLLDGLLLSMQLVLDPAQLRLHDPDLIRNRLITNSDQSKISPDFGTKTLLDLLIPIIQPLRGPVLLTLHVHHILPQLHQLAGEVLGCPSQEGGPDLLLLPILCYV